MSFPANNARPWATIVAHYAQFLDKPWGVAMHSLATQLDAKGFVAAGLHGTTSMFDLLLGTSTDVLNNPRLRVRPTTTHVELQYEDGTLKPWKVDVDFDELTDRVERVLLKRARWFRQHERDRATEET